MVSPLPVVRHRARRILFFYVSLLLLLLPVSRGGGDYDSDHSALRVLLRHHERLMKSHFSRSSHSASHPASPSSSFEMRLKGAAVAAGSESEGSPAPLSKLEEDLAQYTSSDPVELCRIPHANPNGGAATARESIITAVPNGPHKHTRSLVFGDRFKGVESSIVCSGPLPTDCAAKCSEARGVCPCDVAYELAGFHYLAGMLQTIGLRVPPQVSGTSPAEKALSAACPANVLLIGLGGGTFPSLMRLTCPDAAVTSVEVDSSVAELAERYFGYQHAVDGKAYSTKYRLGPKSKLVVEDGAAFVQRRDDAAPPYNVVIIDCFDRNRETSAVPEACRSRNMYMNVHGLLAPGGVLLQNMISSSAANKEAFEATQQLYREVFGNEKEVVYDGQPPGGGGNQILMAIKVVNATEQPAAPVASMITFSSDASPALGQKGCFGSNCVDLQPPGQKQEQPVQLGQTAQPVQTAQVQTAQPAANLQAQQQSQAQQQQVPAQQQLAATQSFRSIAEGAFSNEAGRRWPVREGPAIGGRDKRAYDDSPRSAEDPSSVARLITTTDNLSDIIDQLVPVT